MTFNIALLVLQLIAIFQNVKLHHNMTFNIAQLVLQLIAIFQNVSAISCNIYICNTQSLKLTWYR